MIAQFSLDDILTADDGDTNGYDPSNMQGEGGGNPPLADKSVDGADTEASDTASGDQNRGADDTEANTDTAETTDDGQPIDEGEAEVTEANSAAQSTDGEADETDPMATIDDGDAQTVAKADDAATFIDGNGGQNCGDGGAGQSADVDVGDGDSMADGIGDGDSAAGSDGSDRADDELSAGDVDAISEADETTNQSDADSTDDQAEVVRERDDEFQQGDLDDAFEDFANFSGADNVAEIGALGLDDDFGGALELQGAFGTFGPSSNFVNFGGFDFDGFGGIQ